MALTWKPAIYKNSSLTQLPRPVRSLQIGQSWDMDKHKVPLSDGQSTHGHSKNGVPISVTGDLGSVDGTLKTTEEEMMDEVANLISLLDVSTSSDKFEFFIYHDSGEGTYRKFKDVVGQSFKSELGDEKWAMFSYTCEVFAEDPVIYETSEGS